MSVKSAMAALADAIRSKTGSAEPLSIEGMTQAVKNIQSGDDSLAIEIIEGTLPELVIPDKVEVIRPYVFYGSQSTTITIPRSVKSIGSQACSSCKNLTTAYIYCQVLGDYMFYSCTKLNHVELNEEIDTIPLCAFMSCKSLESIHLPKSLYEIGNSSFVNCGLLRSISVPSGTRKISISAFSKCVSLRSVSLPNSLETVHDKAFDACVAMEEVILEQNFRAPLNLSASTLLTPETMVSMFNALADNIGSTTKTLTLGATNLEKLTDEQIAVATNKNWTLA